MSDTFDLFLDGRIQPPADGTYFAAVNPSTGESFARVANAGPGDLEAAVASARRAFDHGPWKNFTLPERGRYLKDIAQGIRAQAKTLAEMETCDVGKTVKHTTFIDVPTCADTFEYFSGLRGDELASRLNAIDAPVRSITQREPAGVVACIVPWNYPLIIAAWKLAPALMAGNTVILKPSPGASVSLLHLGRIMRDAGLPEGVVNILSTDRIEVAEGLTRHPGVDMISFTGGTETGKTIMRVAADSVKKLTLELGGKSPNIVFSDCDMDSAVGGALSAIFMNQGQMCTAASRLLLQEDIHDEFLARLVDKTRKLKIGPADQYDTEFGPLASQRLREQVLSAVESAVKDGAKIECGGQIPAGQHLNKGFYLEPTILSGVNNAMEVAQEEIFGPVLAVIKFKTVAEAVRLANETRYGLAACIWSQDRTQAEQVARQLRCGTVWINTYGGFYNQAPFGGYKQSGFGRELGMEGLLEYTQSKHICVDTTPGGRSLVVSWF